MLKVNKKLFLSSDFLRKVKTILLVTVVAILLGSTIVAIEDKVAKISFVATLLILGCFFYWTGDEKETDLVEKNIGLGAIMTAVLTIMIELILYF